MITGFAFVTLFPRGGEAGSGYPCHPLRRWDTCVPLVWVAVCFVKGELGLETFEATEVIRARTILCDMIQPPVVPQPSFQLPWGYACPALWNCPLNTPCQDPLTCSNRKDLITPGRARAARSQDKSSHVETKVSSGGGERVSSSHASPWGENGGGAGWRELAFPAEGPLSSSWRDLITSCWGELIPQTGPVHWKGCTMSFGKKATLPGVSWVPSPQVSLTVS